MLNHHIGLQRGMVEVVAYDPVWTQLFRQEKNHLMKECGSILINVEHIGSTAVPDLAAKPLIDMIASVAVFDDYKKLIPGLVDLGYEFMPERVFTNRIFLPKGPRSNRTHHLSIVVEGSDDWNAPIVFRDYIRSNTAVRKAYADLKQSLARRYPDDRMQYTQGKDEFISSVISGIFDNKKPQ